MPDLFVFIEQSEIIAYSVLILGALIAGFTDAVVGGGGLIQVPLLFILFPSLHHTQVIATNRFASVFGTMVAAYQYYKKLGIDKKLVLLMGVTAAIGSFTGVYIMKMIDPVIYKPLLLMVITLLAIYTFIKKDFGFDARSHTIPDHKYVALSLTVGLGIGLYNGTIGPGTGVLLVFGLISILGKDFLGASASAKAINAIADAASLIGFIINRSIVFKLAIPMMVANVTGSYIGSHMAINRGNKFVRLFFLIVVGILIIRFAIELLK